MITTQAKLRDLFWVHHPNYTRKGRQSQNKYPANVRMSFCDFVERLRRDKMISEKLAMRTTL